jgi:hypothetical protein
LNLVNYLGDKAQSSLRRAIEAHGFESDTFLSKNSECPTYGLNLAFGWPLPGPLKTPYEALALRLAMLDSGLYVYPYHQTHVTAMTLVDFKKHAPPTADAMSEFQALVPKIISSVSQILFDLDLHSFAIDVGPPVLSPKAAFLPILNTTGEVMRFRTAVKSLLSPLLPEGLLVPDFIHSTILRFVTPPPDVGAFLSAFDSAIDQCSLGTAMIDEFLLTEETNPYMSGGRILHRFPLKE